MTAGTHLPPFRVIAAALRTTTERLVREVARPQDTPPDWNEFEWAVACAVCAMQGISGLLTTRLKWRGPADFHRFLEEQHQHTLTSHAQIGRLLAQLELTLGDAGMAFIPLKGSAIRELNLHRPGERPQSDIDLLVNPADLGPCRALLGKLGYELLFRARRHHVYTPMQRVESLHIGEHPDNPLKIEVHTKVAEALPVDLVDITPTIVPAQRVPGANRYASLAALMRHVCLHAAGNMRANAVRFIQIHEVGRLARRLSEADWHELLNPRTQSTGAWWLFPPIVLAARYDTGSIPAYVLEELRRLCPPRLRDRYERVPLCDVSWSNLRIAALPGREWSRTFTETLRLGRSRLFPTREALGELATGSASQPRLQQVRWYGTSHIERVARWLITRPPRVQTIAAVSAALQSRA